MWHVTSSSPKVRQLDTFSITSGVCTVCHLQEGHVEWSLSLGGSLWEVIQKIRKVAFQKFSMDFSDLFFCIFLFPSRFVWKKNTYTNKQKIVAALSCGNDHISRSSSQLPLSGIMWSLFWRLMPQWIRDNPINLRSPSVQDLQWSLCRPPIKALKFQIEVGCSYEVPSLWDPFGLLARPEGRQKGDFFLWKKTKSFFVFQRFLFKKEKASNLFQTFPVSCVQMSIFKNVFKATPKTSGFLWFFQQLEKKQQLTVGGLSSGNTGLNSWTLWIRFWITLRFHMPDGSSSFRYWRVNFLETFGGGDYKVHIAELGPAAWGSCRSWLVVGGWGLCWRILLSWLDFWSGMWQKET